MSSRRVTRRRVLRTGGSAGALATVALAGCAGDDADDAGAESPGVDGADDDEDDETGDDSADDGAGDDSAEDETGDDAEHGSPADAVDLTGESAVEIETREGTGDEPAFVFDPDAVRLDAGTTVRWINTDGVFHTVTSTDSLENRTPSGEFDEQLASEGETFEWTADEPGTQHYYCAPHAGFMAGTVFVE